MPRAGGSKQNIRTFTRICLGFEGSKQKIRTFTRIYLEVGSSKQNIRTLTRYCLGMGGGLKTEHPHVLTDMSCAGGYNQNIRTFAPLICPFWYSQAGKKKHYNPAIAVISLELMLNYRVFIKYCVFSLKCYDFLNSASSVAALVFYLPSVCTHTDTGGKQRRARVQNISKSSEKTQYLMNTLYVDSIESKCMKQNEWFRTTKQKKGC